MPPSSGATLTSLTVTVMVSKSSSGGVWLSATRTVIVNTPGPCASLGVQVPGRSLVVLGLSALAVWGVPRRAA